MVENRLVSKLVSVEVENSKTRKVVHVFIRVTVRIFHHLCLKKFAQYEPEIEEARKVLSSLKKHENDVLKICACSPAGLFCDQIGVSLMIQQPKPLPPGLPAMLSLTL